MAKRPTNKTPKSICSFCGKPASQTDTLIEGPDRVFICPECVELCHNIIKQSQKSVSLSINLKEMPELPFKIMLNVGNPDRAFDFQFLPNEGVGLARLEFIINHMIR